MPINPPISLPITIGTRPDWETRLGYPRLENMFVGESGYLYPTPGLVLLTALTNLRAIYQTAYSGGSYIAVTDVNILRVQYTGATSEISTITASQLPVQISENLQNQVTIVDGVSAYVYDQAHSTFSTLTTTQGFIIQNPVSVLVLNTYTIVLGLNGQFQVSNPNNATQYNALSYAQIESVSTQGAGLATINNNLYIIGTTATERWEANLTNDYAFPFQRDNNFICDYGAISTGAISRGIGNIYFLSQKYTVIGINGGGWGVVKADKNDNQVGMAKILSQYSDVGSPNSAYYTFRGQGFYHLTFPKTGISWVWCENSQTWSLNDDLILGSTLNKETVMTSTGIYTLSLIPQHKKRLYISQRFVDYRGTTNWRMTVNALEAKILQGFRQAIEPQYLELSFSIDGLTFGNTVKKAIGLTGRRQDICVWRVSNLSCQELTVKLSYYGDYDFVIERVSLNIN